MSFPVFKQVKNQRFSLIDVINYYQSLEVDTPKGKAVVLVTDKKKNQVSVMSIKDKKTYVFSARQIKLLLRPLTSMRGRDLDIIAGLAVNITAANFKVSRENRVVKMTNQEYHIEIILKPTFAMKTYKLAKSKENDEKGEPIMVKKPITLKNIGYITLHMARQGYDLFGILKTSYAKASKNQSA